MREVNIIGIGQTPVGEHWDRSLSDLAREAVEAAFLNAGISRVDALFVGNMLAGELSHQEHLGALISDQIGLRGIEAARAEASDASGGLALRQGYIAVASGAVETALVLGVEKFTDVVGNARLAALVAGLDAEYEGTHGATLTALAALLMRRYMHEYGVELEAFAGFSENAHANAASNPNAMFHNTLRPGAFAAAPAVAPPVSLFDAAPEGDGAAAVVLAAAGRAVESASPPLRIAASAVATDTLAVQDRPDPLFLAAANLSAGRAYEQAGIAPSDVDVFELHDSYTIMAVLALEACGFARRGEGTRPAVEGEIGLAGQLPIATFGGLKARGHAGGATGLYQVVELALQLRGEAGRNQVEDVRIGMAQNVGGLGGTAVTHILERA
jgi:acetyl-CoA C-acetyltransferase